MRSFNHYIMTMCIFSVNAGQDATRSASEGHPISPKRRRGQGEGALQEQGQARECGSRADGETGEGGEGS